MSQTDSLTVKQRRRIRQYVETWTDLDFSDKKEAVQAVHGLYEMMRVENPRIQKFSDPLSCLRIAERINRREFQLRYNRPAGLSYKRRTEISREFRQLARQDIRRQLQAPMMDEARNTSWGSLFPRPYQTARHYRSTLLAGCANVVRLLGHFSQEKFEVWERIAKSCFWVWLYPEAAVICYAPTQIKRDMNGRFHNEHGPAVKWGRKFNLYFWHGVHVPSFVVEKPSEIELNRIYGERNLEVRRVMIERYGMERFFENSKAKLIDTGELGELYEIRIPTRFAVDELWATPPPWLPRAAARLWNAGGRMTIVKVKNSTPEKDGTYKYYYLQVPNNMFEADAAVAWTFGYRSANRYKRALQQET